ncbi:MAG: hypothetical protein H6712_23080 [Myxococcales bacterium]|nr:hypothetical protein [Myxococcales bacterium]MCB9716760.1 hypothetical protein [Myxococcales bacterium]
MAVVPPPQSRWLSIVATGLLVAAGTGCPKKGNPAEQITNTPDLAEHTGQSKCGVRASAAKPLVVEWPAADRAALEARATRGLVAVRYQGCEMEVLTNCTVDGAYSYLGLNMKREGVRIKSMDELYAQLPVGAVALEGKLERAGQLNVDMVIIGRKEAERAEFNERDLQGRCDEATHVITGLTVGAFSFYAGASAEIGAGVKVGNIGAGGASGSEREVLKQDGNEDSCGVASQADTDAPPGCGALLRVEVVPIDKIFGSSTVVADGGSGSTTPYNGGSSSYPSSSGTSTPDTSTSDYDSSWDPKMERRRKMWAALTITGYGLALGGMGALYAGAAIRGKANSALETNPPPEPGDERQDAIRKAKLGEGLLIGSAVGASVGLVLAVVANAKLKQLNSQKKRSMAFGPTLVPNGAGMGARLSF